VCSVIVSLIRLVELEGPYFRTYGSRKATGSVCSTTVRQSSSTRMSPPPERNFDVCKSHHPDPDRTARGFEHPKGSGRSSLNRRESDCYDLVGPSESPSASPPSSRSLPEDHARGPANPVPERLSSKSGPEGRIAEQVRVE